MTKPGFRIQHLWLYTAIDEDDEEGVVAFLSPSGAWMPLVASDDIRLAEYARIAQDLSTATRRPLKLSRFDQRVDIESVVPDA